MATKKGPNPKLKTSFLSEIIKSLVQAVQGLDISEEAIHKAMENSQDIREKFKAILLEYESK